MCCILSGLFILPDTPGKPRGKSVSSYRVKTWHEYHLCKTKWIYPRSLRPNSASWMGFPPLGCLVVYMTSSLHVMQRSASLLHCLSGSPHQKELSNHVLVMVSFFRGLWFPWLLLILWHGFIHGEYSCQPRQCNLLLLMDVWSQRSSLYLNRTGRWSVHSWFWSSTVETSSNVNILQLQ